MSNDDPPDVAPRRPWRGIKLGKTQIELNGRTACGVFALLILFLSQWLFALLHLIGIDLVEQLGIFQTILGMAAGVLLAPLPTPEDHSASASTSAERLLDLHRKCERLRSSVSDSVAESSENPLLILRLMGIHEGLLEQEELLKRSVGDWQQISPGVVELLLEKQKNNQLMLGKLSKDFGNV